MKVKYCFITLALLLLCLSLLEAVPAEDVQESGFDITNPKNILIIVLSVIIGIMLFFIIYLNFLIKKIRHTLGKYKQRQNNYSKLLEKVKKQNKRIFENTQKDSVSAMAVTANHEIRQPLMVLMGALELLRLKSDIDSMPVEQQRLLLKVNIAALRIDRILEKYKKSSKFTIEKYSHKNDMIKFEETEDLSSVKTIEDLDKLQDKFFDR